MLHEISNGLNGHVNGTHILTCESDYPKRPADVTPQPKWRDAWPMFTHNCGWTDSDGKTHSLTIRTDDADELFGILKAVKHIVRQSNKKSVRSRPHPSEEPQAESDTQPCPIHHNAIMQKRASRSGGHFYSHRLANGDWCNGRVKA